jgi:hypothetical protein
MGSVDSEQLRYVLYAEALIAVADVATNRAHGASRNVWASSWANPRLMLCNLAVHRGIDWLRRRDPRCTR